jgi:3-oxoacyl-[acyl-carrier protein] reductase
MINFTQQIKEKRKMDIDLSGKKALVAGSSQGIGKATAIQLAALGADVILLARNEPRLKTVHELLDTSKGQHHAYLVADFDHPEEVRAKVFGYCQLQKMEGFHILVNNTGGPAGGHIFNADVEDFTQAIQKHLICNHLLVQILVPLMRQVHYGRIINVISTSVKEPIEGLGVSNTTRWAVASWAKTMAGELAKYGITVNNVLPGLTRTGRLDSLVEKKALQTGKPIEDIEKEMISTIPTGRFANPEEIASAIAFLASPAASYITGINLTVDGGKTKSL